MEALLLLAMVVSAGITHAIHNGKNRSKAAYDEYRQRARDRAAARERDAQARSEAWEQRLQAARSTGPSAPLWWAYTAGMVTAGTAAALVAGATGALTGLAQGAAGGWTVGREGGQKGWTFATRWAEWRRRNPRTPIELRQCARCKGFTSEPLTNTAEYGLVCGDCVPAPVPERPAAPVDEEPEEQEDIVHERRPPDDYVPPPQCANRCGFLATADSELCALCQIEAINRRERAEAHRREEARRRREEQRTATPPPPPSAEPQEPSGPIRVKAERIYPDPKAQPQPKEIENTMTALEPATSHNIDDSGEGYSSTVASLEGLANLMKQVHEKVTNLNESLTANSMDIDTLSKLSDMTDEIESVAEKAADLHRHVSDRHGGLATATAEAGGSQNVATKTFYDDI